MSIAASLTLQIVLTSILGVLLSMMLCAGVARRR
jgi:hypothetical protein